MIRRFTCIFINFIKFYKIIRQQKCALMATTARIFSKNLEKKPWGRKKQIKQIRIFGR